MHCRAHFPTFNNGSMYAVPRVDLQRANDSAPAQVASGNLDMYQTYGHNSVLNTDMHLDMLAVTQTEFDCVVGLQQHIPRFVAGQRQTHCERLA